MQIKGCSSILNYIGFQLLGYLRLLYDGIFLQNLDQWSSFHITAYWYKDKQWWGTAEVDYYDYINWLSLSLSRLKACYLVIYSKCWYQLCISADPLVGSIATQYLQNREEHDRIARLWTKRYATWLHSQALELRNKYHTQNHPVPNPSCSRKYRLTNNIELSACTVHDISEWHWLVATLDMPWKVRRVYYTGLTMFSCNWMWFNHAYDGLDCIILDDDFFFSSYKLNDFMLMFVALYYITAISLLMNVYRRM